MIARFGGRCKGCNKPHAKGDDIFWTKEDGEWCWPCRENPKPTPEQHRLADELRFVAAADVERVSWVAICEDWLLRNLRAGPVRETAGRSGPEPRGRNTNLFGEE